MFQYYLELLELFAMIHTDNIKILNALIDAKDGLNKPLFQVSTQQRVGVEALVKKNVLLLISADLDIINKEEIEILVEKYKNTKQVGCQYEVVILSVGETTKSKREDFEKFLNEKKLPWYLVHNDYKINKAVIKYIKEVWHFNNKPILVVLDPKAKVITQNAFANIRVWGGTDLSITTKTEAELWNETSWGVELLLQTIDETKLQWIKENERFICLYGGEDIEWIRKFTTAKQEVESKANNIQFEMVYIGARNLTKQVKENIEIITKEKLSNSLSAEVMSKFWVRLESMWQSRMQVINKSSMEEDQIMKEIKTMFTYDGSEKSGWGLISKGSTNMVKAKGEIILNCFKQYESWKQTFGLKDFMEVVTDYVKNQEIKLHCNRLILPVTIGRIPEEMPCEICQCAMDKFVMYTCCKD
ncbi:protein SIEVE ELEMENT OCCLUSION A-like [Telopea speciosissima]|uniref:protein SIEVE ELEMENT OCCLUSION A-like n=1 Tax=Telopea speciosissima TaxID=54955 RepID=UPI001CC390E8|nr:protein SIEVE ELEMENT OCCLUSION A-like [Telopea speciosissima]